MSTARPLVVLTNPIDPEITSELRCHAQVCVASNGDPATLLEELREADYVVVRTALPNDAFEHTPRLRAAVRHGVGLDMIPVSDASRKGIAVANVPSANANSVAEFVLARMLEMARQLPRIERTLRTQSWTEARELADYSTSLGGKTLVIVGMGSIGQALARICALGLGMQVIGVRRSPPSNNDTTKILPLWQALPQADYLVLACPLTPETHGLIGERELALMKPSAQLLNVARGAVIDETALVEALRSSRLAGAALDVFGAQPLATDSPLRTQPNVLISPHVAGICLESMRLMSQRVLSQLLEMFDGQLPAHLCNPEAGAAIQARWAALWKQQ